MSFRSATCIAIWSVALALVACQDADEAKLEQLRDRGVDIQAEHCLVFTLWFSTKESVDRAVRTAKQAGWHFSCDGAKDGTFYCSSGRTLTPTIATLRSYRKELEQLAELAGGEYDGWDTREKGDCAVTVRPRTTE